MQINRDRSISCLIDTDIAIDFLKRREYARSLLVQWSHEGLLAISTISHLEIFQGMIHEDENTTVSFLNGLLSIDVDTAIARHAGILIKQMRSKGFTTDIANAIIAATAVLAEKPLLTNNMKHYPFPELQVIQGLVR